MRNSRKKGFTLVELVIVVAVITILSAVLVPTFSNVVRKANISSDLSLAKNLNTALTIYDVDNDVNDFDDVVIGLKKHGYTIENLIPKTNGCFFVWEKDTNQILLIDSENNYEVVFSIKEGYGDPDDSWFFAISNKRICDEVVSDLPNVVIKRTITNINDFEIIIHSNENKEIYIDENIILDSNNLIVVENGKEVIIKLSESNLVTNCDFNKIPVHAIKGTLIIEDGNIGNINEAGTGDYATAVGFEGTGKLILKNVTIKGTSNAISGPTIEAGEVTIEITDSTLISNDNGFSISTGGTAVLNNVNVTSQDTIIASGGATITINGGKYNSSRLLIEIARPDYVSDEYEKTSVIINDGEFIFTSELFKFNHEKTEVIINGGTFNGIDYLTYFKTFEGQKIGEGTVVINDTMVIISK